MGEKSKEETPGRTGESTVGEGRLINQTSGPDERDEGTLLDHIIEKGKGAEDEPRPPKR